LVGEIKLLKNKVYPIMLAGGVGSRLWPISRKNYPKQFLKFFDKRTSFFQKTILSFKESSNLKFEKASIFTNIEYRFIVEEQIDEIMENNLEIILEPSSKNTAPSILSAALHILEKDKEAILVILPTDHHIPERKSFVDTIVKAVKCLERGHLMTIGVTPDRPEKA
jgi:mannose-1-phosphate guanylyltransferase/mannose-6-phosphate isomerase